MSSKYPVLDNRPIDQWKVTELKEELRRRKLTVKGLKEDLVRRLDDALRMESDSIEEKQPLEEKDSTMVGVNGVDPGPELTVNSEETGTLLSDTQVVEGAGSKGDNNGQKLDSYVDTSVEGIVQDGESTVCSETTEVRSDPADLADSVQTTITVTETVETQVEAVIEETEYIETKVGNDDSSTHELQNIGINIENKDKDAAQDTIFNVESSHDGDAVIGLSDSSNQVSEVSPLLGFQVKSDSISTDSVSIYEKNELKDNLNTDNCHIEIEVKPEVVQPPSVDAPYTDGVLSSPLSDQKPCENQSAFEMMDDLNMDPVKKIDSSEQLNLDRSSGDDSMEENMVNTKQIDSNHNSEAGDKIELDVSIMDEETVEVTSGSLYSDKNSTVTEKKAADIPPEKRKLEDEEVPRYNEPPKRQRRWNSESLKIPEPQSSIRTPSTTPKDAFQSNIQKCNFTRSDSTISEGNTPKERVVPPSPKSPTTSLRIDRFLRPFTLKAVQDLLAKTGSVSNFWMDHIKTHCYVTYSSVEEATNTRNALYNLQWPTNGGRLLVAEFVDPQEVYLRTVMPPSPVTTISTPQVTPTPPPSQPSPRQPISKYQLPPPPPLPSTSNPPERVQLPPPPPLIKKPDPPIVTLDDLFRKTRATPRIYYLPLSEEQVEVKRAAQGKRT